MHIEERIERMHEKSRTNAVRLFCIFTFAFGNRIALTDDLVIIEATDTSALPTKSRTSRGPRYIYSLSQLVESIRRYER